jgi:hypothetical protein
MSRGLALSIAVSLAAWAMIVLAVLTALSTGRATWATIVLEVLAALF